MLTFKLSLPDYEFTLEFTNAKKNAIKHFLVNYDLKLNVLKNKEVLNSISSYFESGDIDIDENSYLKMFIDFINKPENNQFYIFQDSFLPEHSDERIKTFLDNVKMFSEKENIINFFVIISNSCDDEIMIDFRKSLNILKGNSILATQCINTTEIVAYAMLMK